MMLLPISTIFSVVSLAMCFCHFSRLSIIVPCVFFLFGNLALFIVCSHTVVGYIVFVVDYIVSSGNNPSHHPVSSIGYFVNLWYRVNSVLGLRCNRVLPF